MINTTIFSILFLVDEEAPKADTVEIICIIIIVYIFLAVTFSMGMKMYMLIIEFFKLVFSLLEKLKDENEKKNNASSKD